ncbi:MAG: DUF2946 domain-containing protein [Polaromonas sp.]|nr:DUF2946 domain-containing protein [Polaromonas sp.]
MTAWIACFVMLFASLAPSISHAVTAARSNTSFWAEDCSIHGEVHKAADHQDHQDHGVPTHDPKGSHFEHCPFCLTHAGSFALIQTSATAVYEAGGFSEFPLLLFQAPRLLFVWVSAQARAPPAVS